MQVIYSTARSLPRRLKTGRGPSQEPADAVRCLLSNADGAGVEGAEQAHRLMLIKRKELKFPTLLSNFLQPCFWSVYNLLADFFEAFSRKINHFLNEVILAENQHEICRLLYERDAVNEHAGTYFNALCLRESFDEF